MYYINLFYINSIIGYILESIFYFMFNYEGGSGILYGPWTPIYGIGCILITITFNIINKNSKFKKSLNFLLFFFVIATVLSIIEIIGGTLIECIFHKEFWNYEKHLLNIGKYTSIEMSIVWGVAAIIYILFIKKVIDKIIHIIPKSITYFLTVLFVIDICATIIFKSQLYI